uniref:Uncharacterized protein n=1 Tax=Anguilla anguilla TaxID=7936 RepID=A0A0E9TR44_ANGAN
MFLSLHTGQRDHFLLLFRAPRLALDVHQNKNLNKN